MGELEGESKTAGSHHLVCKRFQLADWMESGGWNAVSAPARLSEESLPFQIPPESTKVSVEVKSVASCLPLVHAKHTKLVCVICHRPYRRLIFWDGHKKREEKITSIQLSLMADKNKKIIVRFICEFHVVIPFSSKFPVSSSGPLAIHALSIFLSRTWAKNE